MPARWPRSSVPPGRASPPCCTWSARSIGFVFQQFFLLEGMSALDNAAQGLLYGGLSPDQRRHQAAATLERVGLGQRLHHRPAQLSGGERQRVAIARALMGRPAVVLADEPTGNLDSTSGAGVFALLRELNAQEGTTILVITHERDLAASLPRRIDLLDGRIVGDSAAGHGVAASKGGPARSRSLP